MRVAVTLLILLISHSLFSQPKVEDILSFPFSELEMNQVIEREEFLSENKFSSPWIRDIDFRLRSDDSELDLEEYRLRFGLMNPFEIIANKDYHRLLISQQSFERKSKINDILLRRYEMLIESYYLSKSISINQQYSSTLGEIKNLLIDEKLDLTDVVDLEMEITKIELRNAGLQLQKNTIVFGLKSFGTEDIPNWNNFSLIDPAQIRTLLGGQSQDSLTMLAIARRQQVDQSQSMMVLKKAEAYSNIGFIQAEYDPERGDDFNRHFGFQVGITIPIFNKDKPALQRRQLEMIEEKAEFKLFASQEKKSSNLEKIKVDYMIDQYLIIDQKFEELETLKELINENGASIGGYKKLADYDYYLLEKGLTFSSDILMSFIRTLHRYGRLADEPFINYLSSDLKQFEVRPN